jgi:hypothetical protein
MLEFRAVIVPKAKVIATVFNPVNPTNPPIASAVMLMRTVFSRLVNHLVSNRLTERGTGNDVAAIVDASPRCAIRGLPRPTTQIPIAEDPARRSGTCSRAMLRRLQHLPGQDPIKPMTTRQLTRAWPRGCAMRYQSRRSFSSCGNNPCALCLVRRAASCAWSRYPIP